MNNSEIDEQTPCPVCATKMVASGRRYSVDELFSMWAFRFSDRTVEQHRAQSAYTQLYVCPVCKFGMFFPQIIGTPDFYMDLQGPEQGGYYSDDKWDFDQGLLDIGKEDTVVEIGCGPGAFLQKARLHAKHVVGQEYNRAALEQARQRGLEVFAAEDDVSNIKGKFDIAFSFHVLEHVRDPVAFVKEMLAWVKPGGKIGISVPNMDGPIKYIDPCVSNMPPHHASHWHAETFSTLAAQLGLKVERMVYEPLVAADQYYYSVYWFRQSWLTKVLPRYCLPYLQRTMTMLFTCIFRLLNRFGRRELPILRGQAIYVLFSK